MTLQDIIKTCIADIKDFVIEDDEHLGWFVYRLGKFEKVLKGLVKDAQAILDRRFGNETSWENDNIRILKSKTEKVTVSLDTLKEFCSYKRIHYLDYVKISVDCKKIKELKKNYPDLPTEDKSFYRWVVTPK